MLLIDDSAIRGRMYERAENKMQKKLEDSA